MSIHDHPPLVTVKSVHDDGPLALYVSDDNSSVHLDLGDEIVTTPNTDLAPLAKAILNAVEPEALAIDQRNDLPAERTPLDPGPSPRAVTVEVTPVLPKDATEQIETAVRAAIAEALRNLADGLVATPSEAVVEFSLWGYKVGDHVKYTSTGAGPEGWERTVAEVGADYLSLADPETGEHVGGAYAASDIRPA